MNAPVLKLTPANIEEANKVAFARYEAAMAAALERYDAACSTALLRYMAERVENDELEDRLDG